MQLTYEVLILETDPFNLWQNANMVQRGLSSNFSLDFSSSIYCPDETKRIFPNICLIVKYGCYELIAFTSFNKWLVEKLPQKYLYMQISI